MKRFLSAGLMMSLIPGLCFAEADGVKAPPEGFTDLVASRDLSGWWGAKTENPRAYLEHMSPEDFAKKKANSLSDVQKHWTVKDGVLINDGKGLYLTTEKTYGDFELLIDYKTVPKADSGIYLKGVPQVQIWDSTEKGKFKHGADKGSGGLWNNPAGDPGKDPLVLADKPFGEWNHFRMLMVGERLSVWLNGESVVDHARLHNYFDKKKEGLPLLQKGPIQLQTHGGEIQWRNIFIRELEAEEANGILASKQDEGFASIFDGRSFEGWAGPIDNYDIVDGAIQCKKGKGGTIYLQEVYDDFAVRFKFRLPPGGNNGLAIRYPGKGDTAYVGMCELQILDNTAPKYAKLDPSQYHGSAYGMAAAHRGYLREPGTWNFQEVRIKGSTIQIELNGTRILDTDLSKLSEFRGGKEKYKGHTRTEGYFGFAGHSDPVAFKEISIKKL